MPQHNDPTDLPDFEDFRLADDEAADQLHDLRTLLARTERLAERVNELDAQLAALHADIAAEQDETSHREASG